jgi:hypothetical protein
VISEAAHRCAAEDRRAQLHLVVRPVIVLDVLRLALVGRLEDRPDLDHAVLPRGSEVPAVEAESEPPHGVAVLKLLGFAQGRLWRTVIVEAQLLREEQLAQLARRLVLGLDLPVRRRAGHARRELNVVNVGSMDGHGGRRVVVRLGILRPVGRALLGCRQEAAQERDGLSGCDAVQVSARSRSTCGQGVGRAWNGVGGRERLNWVLYK